MAFRRQKTHDDCSCEVQLAAGEVDAGADLAVHIEAACPHGCDLGGLAVSIRGEDGAEAASGVLEPAGEAGSFAADCVLRAPLKVGEHRFEVALGPQPVSGVIHRSVSAAFTVTVTAHAMRLNVWDLPSAVTAGERFTFKVGAKCSAQCRHVGRTLRLVDGDGRELAIARLGDKVWPGTSALHFAEVTAEAPAAPGAYEWHVVVPKRREKLAHLPAAARLQLNVVAAPDFEVAVEAVDRERLTPIAGARIVMHPFRTVTDEHGVARLKVPRGEYQILVSGSRYLPARQQVAVTKNLVARAELDREPPPFNPDEAY